MTSETLVGKVPSGVLLSSACEGIDTEHPNKNFLASRKCRRSSEPGLQFQAIQVLFSISGWYQPFYPS